MSGRRPGSDADARPDEPVIEVVARHRVRIQATVASSRPSPAYRAPEAPSRQQLAGNDGSAVALAEPEVVPEVVEPLEEAAPVVRIPRQRTRKPKRKPDPEVEVELPVAEPDPEPEPEPQPVEPVESELEEAVREPRRSRFVMALPAVVGVAALLGAGAAGTSLALRGAATTSHHFVTPSYAGGMPRDAAQEKAVADQIQPIRDSFELQFMGRLKTFASAVYQQSSDAPESPSGPVVFVGATVNTSSDSIDFISAMKSSAAHSGYRAVQVSAGPGARAVCLTPEAGGSAQASSCSWSTGDSIGEVVPTKAGWSVDELAGLMRRLRESVEVSTTR